MKIDKPYNYAIFLRNGSTFAFRPGMMRAKNNFFPGIPTDFLQYKNRHPIDKIPEVLV
jgi:hypothetical protein